MLGCTYIVTQQRTIYRSWLWEVLRAKNRRSLTSVVLPSIYNDNNNELNNRVNKNTKKNDKRRKGQSKRSKVIAFNVYQDARKDNYNKDRTVKSAEEYADHIMKDLTAEAIYSTEIQY